MQTNTIQVQLPTEISYWGPKATPSDVDRILNNLEDMVRLEFSQAPFEIEFERTATPRGNGVHGADAQACALVHEFIETHWTAAL